MSGLIGIPNGNFPSLGHKAFREGSRFLGRGSNLVGLDYPSVKSPRRVELAKPSIDAALTVPCICPDLFVAGRVAASE